MRVRNVLFSMIALAAVDGAEVATAQSRETFTVDGIGGIGASGMSATWGLVSRQGEPCLTMELRMTSTTELSSGELP